MDKISIKREHLKKNFLKQTIIRINYDFLFPKQIQQIMEKLDDYFGKMNYRIEKQTKNDFEINFSENNDINFNSEMEEFSKFVNNEENISVEITRSYSAITTIDGTYVEFDKLQNIIKEVVSKIKEVREYVEFKSIGLRKINSLLIKDLSLVNEYFEKDAISLMNKTIEINSFNKEEQYVDGNYSKNVRINIVGGLLNNSEKVYQIVYDLDMTSNESTDKLENLSEMNNEIFEMFKIGLTQKFLNKLCDDNYEDGSVYLTW